MTIEFEIKVRIQINEKGWVQSRHDFASDWDQNVAEAQPNGAALPIAHSLLQEAIRREIYVNVLLKLQDNPNFWVIYLTENEEGKAKIKERIQRECAQVMQVVIDKTLPSNIDGVIAMMLEALDINP